MDDEFNHFHFVNCYFWSSLDGFEQIKLFKNGTLKLISFKEVFYNVQEILTSIFTVHFRLSVPAPRQKTLTPRDLKDGKDLNNQFSWDDSPMYSWKYIILFDSS